MLSIEHTDVDGLNHDLAQLFAGKEFGSGDFNMHPEAFNLLDLDGKHPCVGRLRRLFLDGLTCWLRAEQVTGDVTVDVILFPNLARQHEFTQAHNHSAEVVGIYYVCTADPVRPAVCAAPAEDYDYFADDDGALILHDPRFNANLSYLQRNDYHKVFPRPGQMLIFPGFLWHSVTPHRGEHRRLSIAANFTIRWPEQRPSHSFPLRLPPI
jgi:hypothetical protein